ncbi:unnamed protein product [Arctia plantaginis]|uniref:Uncharacterized protein n=1 Tax=Arctia plantaginis TaxID=874455 RepID=A0A8S1B8Z7_ARCPL|nr:unnamed protein product [Arctia plantaginis]
MILTKCTLLVGLILTLLSDPILGRKGLSGSHSYPKSGGLSGGGHHRTGGLSGGGHGYPSSSHSGGLSGGGHGYPSSGGSHSYPSSGGSHSYPSSGGSHSYPSSGGVHTHPSSGGSHTYPSSGGSHTYPSSGGSKSYPNSGGAHTYPTSGKTHGYPTSGGGLSGGGHPSNNPVRHTTTVNHYHYSPPAQITYIPRGGAPMNYPVYRGTPPTYVYQYKDSGSKYGTLLAGLALMNLGTLGVAGYAAHQAHQANHGSNTYKPQPGEICKFAIKKENGDYEETKIDCQIISSFILQDMAAQPAGNNLNNSTITTTTTVTNVTIVNSTNAGQLLTTQPPVPLIPAPGGIMYNMLPNGTLVPVVNNPGVPGFVNVTQNQSAPLNPGSSSVVVTTTTTNTTQLVSALDVKGKPVVVTPGMQCFVIRLSPMGNMRKTVPCGVLQTYADKSLKPNAATKHVPMFTVVAAILAYCIAY